MIKHPSYTQPLLSGEVLRQTKKNDPLFYRLGGIHLSLCIEVSVMAGVVLNTL